MIMIRTYMLSIPIISLCFASIQAMDPKDSLARDIRTNDIVRVQATLESNPELAHAHSSSNTNTEPMLMIATEGGNPEMVTLLLKYEPDVNNTRNMYSSTALMMAALAGRIESVRLLLEAGADTNLKNEFGGTALIYAVMSNAISNQERLNIIQQLHYCDASSINEQNNKGKTAFMNVSFLSHLEKQDTITLLLESGADPTIRDNENRTAADIVRSKGNEDLAKFIENYSDPHCQDTK